MGVRKITVADAIEAMRQNNIPMTTGGLVRFGSRVIGGYSIVNSACALGQCGINLGATPDSVEQALGKIYIVKTSRSLASTIIEMNDSFKYSPDKVAKQIREQLTQEQLAMPIEVTTEFSITELKAS